MATSLKDFKNIFFIGIAGSGMSAIAQYLAGSGLAISGSDRHFSPGKKDDIQEKLEAAGIKCFPQNGSGITEKTDLVVVSTAIEATVEEVVLAKEKNIPILKRSEVLAMISKEKKTIAIAGTSGKSTTAAMLFNILQQCSHQPGIITGAGLISIIEQGKIGNAWVGDDDGWLIIEADESDGSIVLYQPEVGLLLNIDKDHQEVEELVSLFTTFKHNTKDLFVCNQSNAYTRALSGGKDFDFSNNPEFSAAFMGKDFKQEGNNIFFRVNNVKFKVEAIGAHNMENALAAIAVANQLGISLEDCATGLANYKGIYRRHQFLGNKNGIEVIDDFGHNPVKCAASIKACQPLAPKVIAWFQPHGYGPTKFLKNDFINEISNALRNEDEIWMSEIYYAGGTAQKTISARELIEGISEKGKHAFFVSNRDDLLSEMKNHLNPPCVVLLMGARDPGLADFAQQFFEQL
ncbi:MAG: UDP-N-acetylmuramate--alanine ligase [Chitinophagaceae bacterium]|nr:MAG: UDP-N-acetylmuramate--alanine ligase [Chitinophagaceae bacterium]